MHELTVGSLFSGIGGFDLGFERAGMRTVWFCEQDPFCQRVLAKHWPGVPCHPDVRALVADTNGRGLQERGERNGDPAQPGVEASRGDDADGRDPTSARPLPVQVPYVDVLCGGFPCQDISVAGAGAGIDGERSGLWSEYARLIRELRPRYVVVENVAALLARGLGRVLGDLAACGYDTEWDCIPASAVGAPHRRDRIWLVAYPNDPGLLADTGSERRQQRTERGGRWLASVGSSTSDLSDDGGQGPWGQWLTEPDVRGVVDGLSGGLDGGLNGRQGHGAVASASSGPEGSLRDVWQHVATRAASQRRGSDEQLARELADALPVVSHGLALGERQGAVAAAGAYVQGLRQTLSALGTLPDASESLASAWLALSPEDQGWVDVALEGGQWAAEWPGVGRVSTGVPHRVDRLRSLGNALVPQIAEWIGRRIVAYEEGRVTA